MSVQKRESFVRRDLGEAVGFWSWGYGWIETERWDGVQIWGVLQMLTVYWIVFLAVAHSTYILPGMHDVADLHVPRKTYQFTLTITSAEVCVFTWKVERAFTHLVIPSKLYGIEPQLNQCRCVFVCFGWWDILRPHLPLIDHTNLASILHGEVSQEGCSVSS